MCLQDTRCPRFSTFIPTSLPHILSELCHKQNSQTDVHPDGYAYKRALAGLFPFLFCAQQVRSNIQEENRINKFIVTYCSCYKKCFLVSLDGQV